MNKAICIDCYKKQIAKSSRRCRVCYIKHCQKTNKKIDCYCKICKNYIGKFFPSVIKLTCSDKCYKKLVSINSKGPKGGNYKDGRTLKKYYCKNCNKQIHFYTKIYGTGLCKRCKSIRLKGKKRPPFTALHIQHIRENRPNQKGRYNNNFGKGCHSKVNHYKGGYYKEIWMRSSWEIKYAKHLDKNNIKWKYECRTFDLGETTYTPDFYLPGKDKYIEVKGYWRPKAIKKFKLFKKLYSKIKIKIIGEKEIKGLL
jgi:hypothetical protein